MGTVSVTASNGSCSSISNIIYVYPCCVIHPSANLDNISVTDASLLYPFTIIPGGGGYSITDLTFTINGTFTVNADLTIVNCTIHLAPEAKIVVKAGKTLTLQSVNGGVFHKYTFLHAGCSVMWDGIYLEDNTSKLVSTSQATSLKQNRTTIIQDARNAVVSQNGGNYNIERTILQANNIDILLNPYSGNHQGVVKGSFLRTGTTGMLPYFVGNVLKPALPRTNFGIKMERVNNIQVGSDASTNDRNSFDNMDYGIYSVRCNLRVFNNSFLNINTTTPLFPPTAPNGISIYAEGFKDPFLNTITVGGSGLRPNSFTNATAGAFIGYGVRVHQHMTTINITGNTFAKAYYSGIYVTSCQDAAIQINNNTITEVPPAPSQIYTAISCKDVNGSAVTITGNQINDQNAANSATKITGGILVQNVSTGDMASLLIQGNTIAFHRYGIALTNITGLVNNQPVIDNNTITFPPLPTSYTANSIHLGITLQNCVNVHVKNNTITRNGAVNAGMVQALQGIRVEKSMNCIIGRDNNITKMGSGIFVTDNCIGSIFACNQLNNCYDGVFFNGVASPTTFLTDQILNPLNGDPAPTGNIWSGNLSDLAGKIPTAINWYYNGTSPSYGALQAGSLLGTPPPNSPTVTAYSPICTQFAIVPPPPANALRQQQLSSIVKNQNQYTSLLNENKFHERKEAFRVLKANPQWLNLGTSDDSLYQQFYTSMGQSIIGKFVTIEDTANTDVATALSINTAIFDTCIVERNQKIVNGIYLNSWAIGNLSFPSADSAILYSIATQDPSASGDAVYSARVMLGLEFNYSNGGSRVTNNILSDNSVDSHVGVGKVYPNPNNGDMQLDYILSQDGILNIYNLMGIKVSSYKLPAGNKIFSIDENGLGEGIYLYQVVIDCEIISSDKLIIIK